MSPENGQESTLVSHLEALRHALIRSIAALTSLLFIAGVAFCLVVCYPLVVKFGMGFANGMLEPVFGISNLVSLAIWLSLAFGCLFQFSLVTYALIRAGIVSYGTVCDKRPYVVVAILLVAARRYK